MAGLVVPQLMGDRNQEPQPTQVFLTASFLSRELLQRSPERRHAR
jgi:hypothetical protein